VNEKGTTISGVTKSIARLDSGGRVISVPPALPPPTMGRNVRTNAHKGVNSTSGVIEGLEVGGTALPILFTNKGAVEWTVCTLSSATVGGIYRAGEGGLYPSPVTMVSSTTTSSSLARSRRMSAAWRISNLIQKKTTKKMQFNP